jgi:glycosyltransferase involved in cell wall biosynthesis
MTSSLAQHGYSVSLVVADGKGDEFRNGVAIIDVGIRQEGRLSRITRTVAKVFIKAKELDAEIYHLHDPELIPIGLKLRKLGKKVIFDAHEDLPKQILSKAYLNKNIAKALSYLASLFENLTLRKFDAIVTATPYIRDKFKKINSSVVDINNYPKIEEFTVETDWPSKSNQITYIGGITQVRGICELIKSLEYINKDTRLALVGSFSEPQLYDEVKRYQGWSKVDELGWLDRLGVNNILSQSIAGIVTLHKTINYKDALPVKMFEYMAAGITVISSDVPLWQDIIEDANCGLCVDPQSPKAIAKAIDYLISNPEEAKRMGENGRKAALTKYNWKIEEQKLVTLYKQLLP